MEIAPGIHHFDTGPFNWYVLEEGGRLTLVDAGFPAHYSVFRKGIRSLGRELKDVEAILLTHSHADHTGFAERLRKETKAPVFVHSADLAAIGKVLQLPWWGLLSNAWRPYIATMLLTATVNGIFTMPFIINARTFGDGDVLDVPGRPRVLHAPGHTPGEVAFYLPERKVLISGDTLLTRNLMTGELGNRRFSFHPGTVGSTAHTRRPELRVLVERIDLFRSGRAKAAAAEGGGCLLHAGGAEDPEFR